MHENLAAIFSDVTKQQTMRTCVGHAERVSHTQTHTKGGLTTLYSYLTFNRLGRCYCKDM